MTEPAEERPRTWMPLLIAGTIAVLVVGGAITTHLLRTDLTPEKRAAADACEFRYEQEFANGPGIVGGDVYSASEWRDLDASLVRLGAAAEQTLTGELADARDDSAALLVSGGGDTMTIIWQLDDESHAQCVAEMKGDAVALVTISKLETTSASPSASPSS